ncbi:Ribosomal RNA small subunit methyltransferase E [Chlamydiales bacterium SCGC AG-110-M15]|nr:Ribosomal RNA small subunit methyltransferase E [Chlamydiales bacterium SCGC AG-110-M15]
MPVDRYFLDSDFDVEHVYSIEGPEHHHLAHVVRGKEGGVIDLVNGRGYLAHARIQKLGRRNVDVCVEGVDYQEREGFRMILAQAMPRANRLDTILEKVTELGVTEIRLFPGERSEKRKRSENVDRMRSVLISAMKQSGRLYIPDLVLKGEIGEWDQLEGKGYFGDISEGAPLFEDAWKGDKPKGEAVFVVGPESGFSEREEGLLREKGFVGVKLSDAILRTDTAPIMALSLVHHWVLRDKR